MAMKWSVKEVAELRGIHNARALGKLAGVPPMSIYQIWSGEAKRVDLETLNKLCTVLRAPLAWLLEHVPDDVEPLPGSESRQGDSTEASRESSPVKTKPTSRKTRSTAPVARV
jgi:DNA-binding Xre family transcriptional regulator